MTKTVDKGSTKCLRIFKGGKSETTMAHKNNVEISSRYNKPE